ncbi:glycerophosphodiester phosphodiesterase [Acrasis kona]|uniref:Glycerophosphodiester phosphodiesterase n=1 Tax=Acrasis kona TaxID=1008807 RepID=A0AAW2YY55_9EUKA
MIIFVSCAVLVATVLLLYYIFKLPESPSGAFFTNVLVGHRGARSKTFPFAENSISAAKYAMEHGSQGIEIDIMLSKDGVPIVFHDTNNLTRVCEAKPEYEANGEVGITDLTVEQIKTYKYLKGPREETIPTCEEFIEAVFEVDNKQVLMIEIKEYERSVEMAYAIDRIFKKHPQLYTQANVASFNPFVLYMVRKINPRIVTNFLFYKFIFADWFHYDGNSKAMSKDYPQFMKKLHSAAFASDASLALRAFYRWITSSVWFIDWVYYLCILTWIPSFIGCAILGFHSSIAKDEAFVRRLQSRGYITNIWVVNEEEQKQSLRKLGNCAITTDILFDK